MVLNIQRFETFCLIDISSSSSWFRDFYVMHLSDVSLRGCHRLLWRHLEIFMPVYSPGSLHGRIIYIQLLRLQQSVLNEVSLWLVSHVTQIGCSCILVYLLSFLQHVELNVFGCLHVESFLLLKACRCRPRPYLQHSTLIVDENYFFFGRHFFR